MASPALSSLVRFLQEKELVTGEQLGELARNPQFQDAVPLLRELVRRGWLTAFQANQLAHGDGKELVVGSYRLLEPIGEGGMGKVFKARHVRMDRIVALKIIPEELLSNQQAVARFYREVRAVSQLSHPNIVTAYEANQEGDTHYFAMEFMDGIDLAKLVRQSGPLTIAQACNYSRQAALGLQHAHEKGLVHRDIKPGNLIVGRTTAGGSPVLKILDFGLARFENLDGQATRVTRIGNVIGTVDYISPEQAGDAREVDIRADIYSLGCSFFYLLTGKPPFEGADAMERMITRLVNDAPSVRILRPDVPPPLEKIVAKMLARNPADRYRNPAEVAAALEEFCVAKATKDAPEATRAKPPSALKAAPAPAETAWDFERTDSRQPKRERKIQGKRFSSQALVGIGAAAGIVLVIALLLLVLLRGDGKKQTDVAVIQPGGDKKASLVVEKPVQPIPQPPELKNPPQKVDKAPEIKPKAKQDPVKGVADPKDRMRIQQAIDKGVKYLSSIKRDEAGKVLYQGQDIGMTALLAWTLLESGVAADSAEIAKLADVIRSAAITLNQTYAVSLAITLLDRLDDVGDEALIEALAVRLLASQSGLGGWSYSTRQADATEKAQLTKLVSNTRQRRAKGELGPGKGKRPKQRRASPGTVKLVKEIESRPRANIVFDNSNTQFAMLALWVARRHGVPVDNALARVAEQFRRSQLNDGTWAYMPKVGNNPNRPSATMTCAGLLGLALGHGINDGKVPANLAGDVAIQSGLRALADMIKDAQTGTDVKFLPAPGKLCYFLFSLDRMALVYNLEKIGDKDWYQWGTKILVESQTAGGNWPGDHGPADTCLALLFLSRVNVAKDLTIALGGKPAENAPDGKLARTFTNSISMELLYIPPGKFTMGSPEQEAGREADERPTREVEITRGFYMGKFEVTQAQYRTVMGKNPSLFSADDFPVEQVSWDDAVEFCRKLSELEKKEYDLPTEAEWEYACRAGTRAAYHFGESLSKDQANFKPGLERTAKVGSYPPNDWGLYDMHGNVGEWCQDWYKSSYYMDGPVRDPPGPPAGTGRVARGGSFGSGVLLCRSAARLNLPPVFRSKHIGFRVVLRISAEEAPK